MTTGLIPSSVLWSEAPPRRSRGGRVLLALRSKFALGAESGNAKCRAYDDSKLGSLLEFDPMSPHAPKDMTRKTITVTVRRLDDVFSTIRTNYSFSRPFLKLDRLIFVSHVRQPQRFAVSPYLTFSDSSAR